MTVRYEWVGANSRVVYLQPGTDVRTGEPADDETGDEDLVEHGAVLIEYDEVIVLAGDVDDLRGFAERLLAALPGDPVVESPSGWSFRASQENGDEVDCRVCGNRLDDDHPIANDAEGYALHPACAE